MVMISEFLSKAFQIEIEKSLRQYIEQEAKVKEFASKQVIVQEGELSRHLYFIIQGIVRGYYIDEKGNDITKCFRSEKQFFSAERFLTGQNASFTIEALEVCKVIQLPYTLIHQILEKNSQWKNVFNRLMVNEIKRLEIEKKNLVLLDAKKRYEFFCDEYPELCGRIDLQYIASYIGIRPQSLSRIRKNN